MCIRDRSQTDTTVSFVVTMTQDMFDAYNEQTYYNLDIAADKDITLADVLGENWVDACNSAVQAYICLLYTSDRQTPCGAHRWQVGE